jgi:dihydroneopterin aldolase
MPSEIPLAFGHPEDRAAAMTSDTPRDRISLRDYVVEVEIGAFQQERGHLQRVRFNIVVEVAPVAQPLDDDVDRILSYDRLTEAIGYELAAERINLLETLAERVALRILDEPQALRVFLRIEKIDRGPYDLGVEIVRAHDGHAAGGALKSESPHPRVMFLTNDAVQSDGLAAWITEQSQGAPLILAVGAAGTDAPQSPNVLAQRRIDLLAIEQNAWVLAGRDKRCVVVGTRTELDWAMRNGQICVWAPSKIVLDAVDGPAAGPRDALAVAVWFAEHMRAAELVVVGVAAPVAAVPVRVLAV